MKTLLVIAVSLFLVGNSVHAEVTKEYIYDRITRYSEQYGVSEGLMTHIVYKESSFNHRAVGDTHLIDPDGKPHRSLGLTQINMYWNPSISESQAFDVDFSLDFLAKSLKQGLCKRWSTCPLSNR
jgi:soluble lytic murein transglycosylase-like protein